MDIWRNIENLPDVEKLASKNLKDLRNLTISQVRWRYIDSFEFTLTDGLSAKCQYPVVPYESHTFNPAKKITRIECIMDLSEEYTYQINFFHHEERLAAMGKSDD